jgi:3-oxoacyl-[acyl-carrier protein] reductase
MDLGITGRRAVVCGSSSGIGLACATQFVREGAEVLLVARNEERLGRICSELGANASSVAADISNVEGVERVRAAVEQRWGGADILINNAGGPKPGPFDALGDEDWMKAFELNLMSAVRLTRALLPGMIEKQWGRIVNITSVSVKQPVDNLMLSNSLRMAVVGFAKTLGNEVSRHGITINTVGPGFTRTDRLEQLATATAERQGKGVQDVYQTWASEVPLRRIGEADEVAAAVVFLASNAASYINGVVLAVDGGRIKASM